ncbi:MAG: formate dehydrogenase accessory sulfurtransferase FdhD [Actinomycetota bacterium]
MARSIKTKEMSAIILAGGKSTRMGRDKSSVMIGGETLLGRSVRMLKGMFDEVIVVNNGQTPPVPRGVKVVHDDVPYQGPLGGISAGLKASSHDENLVVAVDMPFVNHQVINYLASFVGEADAVVPKTNDGLQPLFAFYSKSCLPAIERALADKELKVTSLFSHVRVKYVDHHMMAHLSGADKTFININTEDDLKEVEEVENLRGCAETSESSNELHMPVERATTIYVNSEELVTLQTSLEHLDELACGFLISEGILQSRDELVSVRVNEDTGEVRVRTKRPNAIATRVLGKRLVTSGCGKGFSFINPGDALGIARIDSNYTVSMSTLYALMAQFLRQSQRPGMHSSALVDRDGVRFIRQDIGRHNTVDMILGRLWLDGSNGQDAMLFTTGRVSYEMIVKAAKARFPVVVSRTAATDTAVKLAERLGVELVGYVRGAKARVYTDGNRITSGR